ncbi:acetylajmalan esterase [Manihot esculenta]|uniref:Uncharacterized protein n=2 Tax=Manihot esculenta TaxID=3983 RepID=A0ACC8DSJ9_MANES|nr:acetylajmalan esterase [Manihot esculenta]OAY52796.2 hypothetical protein MANES_04G063980v8 [Manihot esculenta]
MGFLFALFINSIFIFIQSYSCDAKDLMACKFDAIYQLGDSISDTGNSIIEMPQAYHARFPYGQTIHKATGRSSDGYLIIDYIAQSAGLPLLEPYENPNSTFIHGVNFAVAGATASSIRTLRRWHLPLPYTNSSLYVQARWLKKHLFAICNDKIECERKLKHALYMIGTIGCNDYIIAFQYGKSIEEVKVMVPRVIQSIKTAIRRVIRYGAYRVVVPGAFQLGCAPSFLTAFSSNKSSYDSYGCLKDYNDFFMYHNNHLQVALQKIREKNPHIHIIYGDLYGALEWILDNFSNLGFTSLRKGCCGIGGRFNYNPSIKKMCGAYGVPICPNPKEYVFWDGSHFSHEANKYMSKWLVKDILPQLQCNI